MPPPRTSTLPATVLRGARLVGEREPVDVMLDGGRVVAIAPTRHPDRASTRSTRGTDAPAPTTVDLDGRLLVPGLWDAHVHLLQRALARRRLDVSRAASAREACDLVAERLRRDPPRGNAVLVGFGFRDAAWPDAPTREALDAAAGGHAVVLVSGDLHCAWFSSPALVRFARTSDETGLVREDDFFPVAGALDAGDPAERDAWVREAAQAAAARGVVGVIDMEAEDPREWNRRLDGVAHHPVRVASAVWPQHLDDVLAAGLTQGDALGGVRDALGEAVVRIGPLKVITDGSLNTRTAYCHDDYPGGGRGVLNVAPTVLAPLLARARAGGFAGALHAIGDAAVALALDAFAATGARGSIEHAQLLTWDDVPRMAALGVVASVQPAHLLDDRDVVDHVWPGRSERMFPFATLLAAGVELRFGSDAPVAPLDPLLAIDAAVRRTGDARAAWHPEQRIAVVAALEASTLGAGVRPTVGAVADLAVLDAAGPDELTAATPVAGTLQAGRWTHRTL